MRARRQSWCSHSYRSVATGLDPGRHDVKVSVGGQTISPGDLLVLDGDSIVRVSTEIEKSTFGASKTRVVQEERLMSKLVVGESTLDLMNLRSLFDPSS